MSQPRGIRESAKAVLRKLGLYPLAAWIMLRLRVARHELVRRIPRRRIGGGRGLPEGQDYDIICLPVIAWHSRFQRPQQLMRHWSERGHRVFYASLQFHHGEDVILSGVGESGPNNLGASVRGVAEIGLPGPFGTSVYGQLPTAEHVDRMVAAIDRLRRQRRIAAAVVVVHLPFWTALAEKLRERFGWPIVYDCMDDHSGFSTNNEAMLRAEDQTVSTADLVVVTSEVLRAKVASKARRIELIRSACDYEHFAHQEFGPSSSAATKLAPKKQPTIGYYGAIAEWFDGDLVADLAALRPDWRFELIGSTFTGDVSRLENAANVTLLGEKPYVALPRLIAHWDCCVIPFKRLPLTEATNPMKAYEIMAAGKPLVTVDLPELRLMAKEGLLSTANDAAGFAAAIESEMAANSSMAQKRRRAFAKGNTWPDRCSALDNAVRELSPQASIIIVTYNNLAMNRACLESIYRYTDWPNYEVIIVDNASTDGTAEWLAELERWDKSGSSQPCESPFGAEQRSEAAPRPLAGRPRIRVILNKDNRGYSAANNQGLRAAGGEFLCLLNNDTLVTHGWLSTLIGHLRTIPGTGIVGPVSNRVGNEAMVPVSYTTPAEMPGWAAAYCREHDGETSPIQMLGFFCVVFPRAVYERVGELDERFGIGCFEDDDYCHRARLEGYELRFARDAFVHHWQGASFQLLGCERSIGVFHENKRLFHDKWAAAKTS